MTVIIADRRLTNVKVDSQRGRIQANIRDSHQYFQDNAKRFNFFRHFVFKSSMSSTEVALNQELNRPQIEFNIMEAKLSRLLGEFSKQEPNLKVSQSDAALSPVDPALINVIDGYCRSIFFESNRDNMEYEIYRDIITGGYSVFKVYTEYSHEMSFDQNIVIKRCFDPTLTGFDKMAVDSHKGDGMFCFECFPRNREEFETEYGKEATEKMKFQSKKGMTDKESLDFNWSYSNEDKDIVMIVDYWEKKKTKVKIVKVRMLSGRDDGSFEDQVMTMKEYKDMISDWAFLAPPPEIVGEPRETETTSICRYRLCEDSILEYAETDYKYLPLVFCDGNSLMLRGEDGTGSAQQMTRPMMYNMIGLQKLKNFIGIMIANHIENTPQSQWVVAKESIPEQYVDAWVKPQVASLLVMNAFMEDETQTPLPPPQLVRPVPLQTELFQAFMGLDSLSQTILGSYDSSLGINDNQLSGTAISNGATQSNAATTPYMVGYIRALNRAAEIIVDLIPKYIDSERSLPIRSSNGAEQRAIVNGEYSISVDYNPLDLKVKVEAGINFELQRKEAFATLMGMMEKVAPIGQFISTEEAGIEMILDNLDIKGIDALKQNIKPFMKKQQMQMQQQMEEQKQQMQMQQQQAQMQTKILEQQAMAPAMQAQQRMKENEIKELQGSAKLTIEEYEALTRRIDVMRKAKYDDGKIALDSAKAESEDIKTALDVVQSSINEERGIEKDIRDFHHKVGLESVKGMHKTISAPIKSSTVVISENKKGEASENI